MPDDLPAVPDLPRRPWERQHGETTKAFQAFCVYRDLGVSRSLAAVSSELAKDKRQIELWSSQWGWVRRVEEYEIEQDRLDREANRRAREEALKRHRALAAMGTSMLFRRLRGHGEEGDDDYVPALDPAKLSAADVARFASEFVRIERMAFGEPTDLVRGAFMVTSHEVSRVVSQIVDCAMTYIPSDRHEAFVRDVRAIGAGS